MQMSGWVADERVGGERGVHKWGGAGRIGGNTVGFGGQTLL